MADILASAPSTFNQEHELLICEREERAGHSPDGENDVPVVLRLFDGIDLGIMKTALVALVLRHSALRTAHLPTKECSDADRLMRLQWFGRTALFVPGLFQQVIQPVTDLRVCERDVPPCTACDDAVAAEVTVPLNHVVAPAMRATILRTGDGSRILVLLMSHLALDGWSVRLLMRDLSALYGGAAARRECRLPPIAADCADFARWQHEQFRSGALRQHEEFWKQEWEALDDAQICHRELPFGRVGGLRDGQKKHVTQSLQCTVNESAALRAALMRYHITAYTLFRSALTVALHHYTRKRRIGFWANFLNRSVPRFVDTTAWCATTNVVTVDVTPDEVWWRLCGRIDRAIRRAQSHDALPLPALWQRLGRRLDTHDTRVNFDLHVRRQAHALGDVMRPPCQRGVDLDIRLVDSPSGFSLVSGHNQSRYDSAGVARLLAAIRDLALHWVSDPSLTIERCATIVRA